MLPSPWLLYPPPGLIIDAFGELRDQQEQVKEDMEVSRTDVEDDNSSYTAESEELVWDQLRKDSASLPESQSKYETMQQLTSV